MYHQNKESEERKITSAKRINEALRLTLDKILEYATDCEKGKISYERLIDYIIAEADRATSLYSKPFTGRTNEILRASLEEIRAEAKQKVSVDRIIYLSDNALQLYAYDLINQSKK